MADEAGQSQSSVAVEPSVPLSSTSGDAREFTLSDFVSVSPDGSFSVVGSLSDDQIEQFQSDFDQLHQDLAALTYSLNFLAVTVIAFLIFAVLWRFLSLAMGRG